MATRVDVMSLKGGAGKTTLAFRIASAQARASKRPVLIIDADLSGSCLGDLLEPWANPAWGDAANLVDLVCDRPETLPEHLAEPDSLPLFRLRAARPTGADGAPAKVVAALDGPELLFCPSHVDSVKAHVEPPVLHALVGHESAGGWVSHVIDAIAQRAEEIAGSLGGIIVDHSPGLSALPWASLQAIERPHKAGADRKALFVTTPDLVDLRAWDGLHARPRMQGLLDVIEAHVRYVVNRVSPQTGPTRTPLRKRLPELAPEGRWLDEAQELPRDEELARAYEAGGLVQLIANADPTIEPLRALLFGAGKP